MMNKFYLISFWKSWLKLELIKSFRLLIDICFGVLVMTAIGNRPHSTLIYLGIMILFAIATGLSGCMR